METAEQARQGHVSKHNRHAVGSATRSGGPGEGDRSRGHQVAEEDTSWCAGHAAVRGVAAGRQDPGRTCGPSPGVSSLLKPNSLSFFPCCNLRKGLFPSPPPIVLCSPS